MWRTSSSRTNKSEEKLTRVQTWRKYYSRAIIWLMFKVNRSNRAEVQSILGSNWPVFCFDELRYARVSTCRDTCEQWIVKLLNLNFWRSIVSLYFSQKYLTLLKLRTLFLLLNDKVLNLSFRHRPLDRSVLMTTGTRKNRHVNGELSVLVQ